MFSEPILADTTVLPKLKLWEFTSSYKEIEFSSVLPMSIVLMASRPPNFQLRYDMAFTSFYLSRIFSINQDNPNTGGGFRTKEGSFCYYFHNYLAEGLGG